MKKKFGYKYWLNKGGKKSILKKLSFINALLLILQISFGSFIFVMPTVETAASDPGMCAQDVDVVLVMDRSGSMDYTSRCDWWQLKCKNPPTCSQGYEWIKNTTYNQTQSWCTAKNQSAPHQSVYLAIDPKKIVAAKEAADNFVDLMGLNDQSGLVSYASTATLDKGLSHDHAATQSAIDALVPTGATNIGDAINLGTLELRSGRANAQAVKAMILLTDGLANKPSGPGNGEYAPDVAYAEAKAAEAAGYGFKIFTIGLGENGEINETMLENIANITGADYYHAPTQNDLEAMYDKIALKICQYGSIAGCKYSDTNKDGVISGEEKIPGWEIILNNSELTTQLTDDSGCYQFSGLTPGTYTVSEGGKVGVASEQTYPVAGSYSLNLGEGQNLTDIDFGNYLPICGNSFVDTGYGEVCEIGQTQNCTGGTQTCLSDCSGWDACVPSGNCGDGNVDAGEECDGDAPEHYICTDQCTLEYQPYCGDNLVNQPIEQCDGSAPEICTTGNGYTGERECAAGCIWSDCQSDDFCGDAEIDGPEICDDGTYNGQYGYCNADCTGQTPAVCGDKIKNGTEECDGTDGVGEHQICTAECVLENVPYCGDNIVNNSEICDGNSQACSAGGYDGSQLCNADCDGWQTCQTGTCGDGVINGTEACDGDAPVPCVTTEGYDGVETCVSCQWGNCTSDDFCGDNIKNGNEQCDGQDGVIPGFSCSGACILQYNPQCIGQSEIVINEIMYDPQAVSDTTGEWFEVYNNTDHDINLRDCTVRDLGTNTFTISSDLNIASHDYAVLAKNSDPTQNGGITPDYVYVSSFSLANTDDEIIIECCSSEVDRVEYNVSAGWPHYPGKSMILKDPNLDNNIKTNWCISSSTFGSGDKGTPGAVNDACGPICGNQIVESGEQCDGNSGSCTDVNGYNGTKNCTGSCTWGDCSPSEYCGDLVKNGPEQCDGQDGIGANQACDQTCHLVNLPYCGDNIVNGTEICDGNSQACQSSGYNGSQLCNADCNGWQQCNTTEFCGDNLINDNEECDGDAPKACTTQSGYTGGQSCVGCVWGICQTNEFCGDKIVNGTEICDGGTQACSVGGYNGSQNCTDACNWGTCNAIESCGDGVKNGSEQCDGTDGVGAHEICSAQCTITTLEYCGDGVKNGDEQCDDGNDVSNDGCSASCQTEYGSIKACKLSDYDGNMGTTGDRTPVVDWVFTVTGNQYLETQNTGQDGCAVFSNLAAGSYDIKENNVSGWTFLDPNNGQTAVYVNYNQQTEKTFYNFEFEHFGSVCGYKFEDPDGNAQTANTTGLAGWEIDLFGLGSCSDGQEWADQVVSYTPGARKDGSPILAERTDASKALGLAQNNDTINFVALGYGGSLVLKFDNIIVNGVGSDVEITETTFGVNTCATYPERVHLYASQTGADGSWADLGTGCLDSAFDLGGLPWAQYLKFVDATDINSPLLGADTDGYDIDGVRALHCSAEGWNLTASTTTDVNGRYCFQGLSSALYRIQEVLQNGWFGTSAIYEDKFLGQGQNIEVNFNNSKYGKISGFVLADADGSGGTLGDRTGLADWTVKLFDNSASTTAKSTATTTLAGYFEFTGLVPGDYSLAQVLQAGWAQLSTPASTLAVLSGSNLENNNFINYQTPAPPVCGNGIVESGEECDGGTNCTASCAFKVGGSTTDGGSTGGISLGGGSIDGGLSGGAPGGSAGLSAPSVPSAPSGTGPTPGGTAPQQVLGEKITQPGGKVLAGTGFSYYEFILLIEAVGLLIAISVLLRKYNRA